MKKDFDYIKFYVEELKKDNKHFEEQKMLIDSQIDAHKSLFSNWAGPDFKVKARKYLKARGII